MNRRIVVGRGQLLIAAMSALGAVLALPGGARAAQDVVTTRETAVRSAPFDVAPEIVHAAPGIHFAGADQTQGGWRRVQLPDGRFGYLHDGDVIPTGNPANAGGGERTRGERTSASERAGGNCGARSDGGGRGTCTCGGASTTERHGRGAKLRTHARRRDVQRSSGRYVVGQQLRRHSKNG